MAATLRTMFMIIPLTAALTLSGCGSSSRGDASAGGDGTSSTKGMRPLSAIAKEQEMVVQVDPETHAYQLGYTDPILTLTPGEAVARSGDHSIPLPDAPKLVNGELYLSQQAANQMLSHPSLYGNPDYAPPGGSSDAGTGGGPHSGPNSRWTSMGPGSPTVPYNPSAAPSPQSAADGSNGPSGGAGMISDSGTSGSLYTPQDGGASTSSGSGMFSIQSASASPSSVLAYGRQFIGTPYRFSSGPYPTTRTFDCSSFTQYVFGRFGIKLPRASKDQAHVGQYVRMSELRAGDLMFFYTPGRYASNNIVGHVGVYAGNGRILHTYGAPGVTYSTFSTYWKGRFLYGRRVLR